MNPRSREGQTMRRSWASLAGAILLAGTPAAVRAQEAPFGLSWGPLTSVPRPSMVDREGTINPCTTFHDRPTAAGGMTQEVVLEVCKDEGPQQVVWVSQSFPEDELATRYGPIYREGVQRYGLPQDDPRPHTVVWPGGRTLLAVRPVSGDQKRLIMISTGDRYERCSDAHVVATGHRASLHTSTLLDPDEPGPR